MIRLQMTVTFILPTDYSSLLTLEKAAAMTEKPTGQGTEGDLQSALRAWCAQSNHLRELNHANNPWESLEVDPSPVDDFRWNPSPGQHFGGRVVREAESQTLQGNIYVLFQAAKL